MGTFRHLGPQVASHLFHHPSLTICRAFAAQVEHRPGKIAVIEDDRQASFAELAGMAAGIAHALVRTGVRPGDRVAILSGRALAALAGQLGTLAVGAAFVPLDPAHPPDHQRTVLAEATPTALLFHPAHEARARDLAPPGLPVLALDDPAAAAPHDFAALLDDAGLRAGPEDLAYVIYTSGSTGRPKGVMVPHRGVCRLVRGQDFAYLGPDQVMLHMAAVAFDASIIEIYTSLLNGGTLVVLADSAPSLDRLAEVIARHGVTTAHITAGLFHVIAEHAIGALAPLRQIFPCGDVLSETHVRRVREVHPHIRLINGYGPAENTVGTCFFTIDETSWQGGPVPIGRPLRHDRLFILDEENRPLAAGEVGQIAVGGAGLALGYLGRPDLTAERFVTVTFGDFAGRVYLTGDLGSVRPDGVVLFHGRADRQVKINGQRVELDAVEHALRAQPGVEEAAALPLARPDGTRQIVAVLKAADPAGDLAERVLAALRRTLPAAMVPSRLVVRADLPLSGSGKVDRRRLLEELEAAPRPEPAPPAPGAVIAGVWGELLALPSIPPDRTFFDLGGTSLQLIAAHALLQQRLGRRFPVALLFEATTLRDLERALAPDGAGEATAANAARRAAMDRARQRRGLRT